jgi:hypothetical protein
MSRLGYDSMREQARDVMYSVSASLARNYCAASPDLPPWETMPGAAEPARSKHRHISFPKVIVPSEDSILAALIRSRHKCVSSLKCIHACMRALGLGRLDKLDTVTLQVRLFRLQAQSMHTSMGSLSEL